MKPTTVGSRDGFNVGVSEGNGIVGGYVYPSIVGILLGLFTPNGGTSSNVG